MFPKICIIYYCEYNLPEEEGFMYNYNAIHYQHTCYTLIVFIMDSASESATKNKNKTLIIYLLLVVSNLSVATIIYISQYSTVKNWFIPLCICYMYHVCCFITAFCM